MARSATSCLLVAFFFGSVNAHGRLLVPRTRLNNPGRYENDPVNRYSDNFVCRHDDIQGSAPYVRQQITAGQSMTVRYVTSAPHVGDCAFYLSYDNNLPRSQQRFFKIANIPNCKEFSNQDITIQLPPWLPAGDAIMRWDWYALHVNPGEFYAQCSDITVVATSQALPLSQISPQVRPNDMYPAGGWGTAFRSPYNGGSWNNGPAAGYFFSGISCANGFDENDCACTAPGTQGRGGRCGGATPINASPPPPVIASPPPPPPVPVSSPPPPGFVASPPPPGFVASPPPPRPVSSPPPPGNEVGSFTDLVVCFSDCFLDFRLEYRATHSGVGYGGAVDVDSEGSDSYENSLERDILPLVTQALETSDVPMEAVPAGRDPVVVGVVAGVSGFVVGVVLASLMAFWATRPSARVPPPPPAKSPYNMEQQV